MDVVVEGNHVIEARGVPGDPRTDGTLCAKGLSAPQTAHDPRRLLYPLRNRGARGEGKFEQISWDEALDELAGKMLVAREEKGPHSVAFCRGQAPGWAFVYDLLQRLTHAFGTEPGMGGSECFVPRAMGEVYTYAGMPLFGDYDHTDLMIFWGKQPAFSTATQMRKVYDARDRGAKLVVIDPLQFHVGATADQFIRIEPGTDLAMMLAMLFVIVDQGLCDWGFIDTYTNDPGLGALRPHLAGQNRLGVAFTPEWAEGICGVDAGTIRALAIEYATTPRACILPGHGLEGRTNVTQTSRALAILRLVTGHFDAEGSDVTTLLAPPRNREFFLEDRVVEGFEPTEPVMLFAAPPYNPPQCTYPLHFSLQGLLPTPDLLREMREGNIRVAIFQGGNPMVMLPRPSKVRADLEKVDYIAVLDPYLSETAQLADLVLPAATYLERTEPEWFKYDYALTSVKLRQKAVTVGEAWPDTQILIELGRRLGFTHVFPTDDVTWYIDELLKGTGITYQRLVENPQGIQAMPVEYRKYEKMGFALPGGKAHIRSVILEHHGFDPLPVWEEPVESSRNAPELAAEYPFVLFTGRAGPMYVHCQRRTIPWAREIRPEPMVMIHPDKAAELGIEHGDWTVVESPRGGIRIKAEVTRVIGPNCLYVPGGWAEANYNELGIDDAIDPISSQANYMMCAGRIRKE
jgi:anaerobic selenocysteine-containing dehydrogenase